MSKTGSENSDFKHPKGEESALPCYNRHPDGSISWDILSGIDSSLGEELVELFLTRLWGLLRGVIHIIILLISPHH